MASLLNKTHIFSLLRSNPQFLAKDKALSKFKSHKQGVKRIKKFGDIFIIVIVAGCCYELYVRPTTREEARKPE
ncbi:hypothetical protein KSS87_002929 [Heliosperma pusillum]|nr:hypothetical protein KSS87_002929 [Heliosperma pusillum]